MISLRIPNDGPHAFRRACGGFLCTLLLLLIILPHSAQAHSPLHQAPRDTTVGPDDAPYSRAPRVYIDCNRCDYNHIRREITFVSYVREPERADVHVFVTNERTGGGGWRYELSFIGRAGYSDVDHTLTHTVSREATWAETREGLNEVIKMGLVPFVMRTPVASQLSVQYDGDAEDSAAAQDVRDPWDYWVFEIYGGRVSMSLESNQTEFDSRWGFFADRVTQDWKIRLRPYFNFSYDSIDQGDETATSRRHRHGFDSFAIMSLSDHWSAGLFGNYLTRNDRNLNHRFQLNPGVEYSIFPYEESARRAITFVYRLGYTRANYYEQTIFGQTEETLLNHRLQASMRFRQPWGDVYTGLSGSHYLHDVTLRRATFYGSVSVRVTEGLSLSLRTDFEMIQDQLSLPAGETSLEEILLEQRELATDFSLSGSVALSYTFGSDFANIVNTRF